MTAALDARGLKRICMNCGTRFYDMNKRPVVCPSCETEFTGEIKVKTRRSRAAAVNDPIKEEKAAAAPAKDQTEDSDIEEKDEDTISLQDVDDGSEDDEDEDLDLSISDDLENIDDMDDDMDDDGDDLDINVVSDDDD